MPTKLMRKNVPNALAEVGLAGKYKAKTKQLSGGEQQRVALARALVNEPPILLADEPTGALDSKATDSLLNLFSQINAEGQTIVMVTHSTKQPAMQTVFCLSRMEKSSIRFTVQCHKRAALCEDIRCADSTDDRW